MEAVQITYADGKPTYEAEISKGKESIDLLLTVSNMLKKVIFKNKQ